MHTIPFSDYTTLLKCLKLSGGQLFGGLVRSLTMGTLDCADIDIWFTSNLQKDKFLNAMKDNFTTDFTFPFDDKFANDYDHERFVGRWQPSNYVPSDENSAIMIDMVVSPTFLTGPFTCNSLSYDREEYTCHDSRFTVEQIKDQIKNKESYIYDDFVKKIKGTKFEVRYCDRLSRMKARGYKFQPLSSLQTETKVEVSYKYVNEKDMY